MTHDLTYAIEHPALVRLEVNNSVQGINAITYMLKKMPVRSSKTLAEHKKEIALVAARTIVAEYIFQQRFEAQS
jgi:hypothetical protein